jgi:flagellin-like protein
MAKGISPLISTVIVIMMVVSAISMVLLIGRPTIDKATEASVVNEALLNMKSIDSAIKEVASEGVQSSRTVTFKVSDGNYKIVNDSGVLFEKELLQSVYSFNTITFDGDVKSAAGVNPLGLVGFWKFDEGSGSVANDSSGKKNDGTLNGFSDNAINWTTGKHENALQFDGVNDYVSIPDSNDWYFGSSHFTIDFWVRFNALPTGYGSFEIVGQRVDANNRYTFDLYNSATDTYQWYLYVVVNSTVTINVYRTTTVTTGSWYHVAYVRTGSNFKIFQNGIQLGSDVTDADEMPDLATPMFIGATSALSQYMNGWLDDLHIYHRSLSAGEVRDDYISDSKHYYVAIDYDRIQIVGTDTFQKGIQKLCVQKIGETGNKAVVEVTTC